MLGQRHLPVPRAQAQGLLLSLRHYQTSEFVHATLPLVELVKVL